MTMRCVVCAISLVGGLGPGAVAQPHTPTGVVRVLIDRSLVEHRVELLAVGPRSIAYLQRGIRHDEPIERLAALIDPEPWADAKQAGERTPRLTQRLELVDGQRLIGALEPDRPAMDESLVWSLPGLGRMVVPLERIARIDLVPGGGHASETATSDRVELINGDGLTGFVAQIGSVVVVEADAGVASVPIERVAQVTLSNPAMPPTVPMVWLDDGSVVGLDALGAMDGPRATLMLDVVTDAPDGSASAIEAPARPQAVAMTLGRIRAIQFDAGLVPLARLPIVRSEPAAGRRWAPRVQTGPVDEALLGSADITLPGPMRVVWSLPAGSERVALTARLPESMRSWGDCEVVVSSVDAQGRPSELARSHLWADEPATRINEALMPGASRVAIEVLPGAYGPIQDVVVLERALVLAGAPADE